MIDLYFVNIVQFLTDQTKTQRMTSTWWIIYSRIMTRGVSGGDHDQDWDNNEQLIWCVIMLSVGLLVNTAQLCLLIVVMIHSLLRPNITDTSPASASILETMFTLNQGHLLSPLSGYWPLECSDQPFLNTGTEMLARDYRDVITYHESLWAN